MELFAQRNGILYTFIFLSATSVLLARSGCIKNDEPVRTLQFLDEMNQYMKGSEVFSRRLFRYVKGCMDFMDDKTFDTQNKIWEGMLQYWSTRGAKDDVWGKREDAYYETNLTTTNIHGMEIYEPCNCASNIAYHHTMLEICRKITIEKLTCISGYLTPLRKALAYLVPSSYFHHASRTKLGLELDLKIIDVMTFLTHQSTMHGLPYNPILHDLSEKSRKFDSLETLKVLESIYANDHVSTWRRSLKKLNVPSRRLSISAYVGTSMVIGLNSELTKRIAPVLLGIFGISGEEQKFLLERYIPTLTKSIKHIKLGKTASGDFKRNSFMTFAKVGYSLLWFESDDLSKSQYGPITNIFGSLLLPELNLQANKVNTYTHTNKQFQLAKNVYPGEEFCNPRYPHAKWHIQSAIALVDAVKLADDVCHAIKQTFIRN